MDLYKQIRKLRKKLRQIEHLEGIERDLNDEEVQKCMKKEEIRDELRYLLQSYNANTLNPKTESDFDSTISTWGTASEYTESDLGSASQSFADIDSLNSECVSEQNFDEADASPSQVEFDFTGGGSYEQRSGSFEDQPADSNNSNIGKQTTVQEAKEPDKPKPAPKQTVQVGSELKKPLASSQPPATKKAKATKGSQQSVLAEQWRNSGFIVTALEGHNDLITAVDCSSQLFVSASRDTTVKVWDMTTFKELRSLGGHLGSVTDVLLIKCADIPTLSNNLHLKDTDHLVLSASTDCSLNLWSASTGEKLSSIYTYNPIMKIAFHKDSSLVATASDGGKLELWDVVNKENICSEHAHSDSVTGLCISGKLIFTSCAVEGEIKVFELRERSLHCMFVSENVRNISGQPVHLRHVRALCVKGENLYYGDDGVNVKILSWKNGLVKKFCNHREEFGMTDVICCHGDIMLTSAYDLDNGQGYMNVFDVRSDPSYLATIDNSDTGRILDICCCHSDASTTIVTAGVDLLVWKQVIDTSSKKGSKQLEDLIPAQFEPQLAQFAVDSDLESEAEFSESSEEEEGPDHGQKSSRRGSVQEKGWMSWCSVV